MPLKYNQTTLEKIEKILEEAGYVLRFEKGNFNSGYCILEHRKVVVINKFLDLEGRINVLTDILGVLRIEADRLTADSRVLYEKVVKEGLMREKLLEKAHIQKEDSEAENKDNNDINDQDH